MHLIKTRRALPLENLGGLLWPTAFLLAVLEVRLVEKCWQTAWATTVVL